MDDKLLESQFLASLYSALKGISQNGILVSNVQEESHSDITRSAYRVIPHKFGWRWILRGTAERWWLEILDDRAPMRGRPYYIDPHGDEEFFALAAVSDVTTSDRITYFVSMLLTHMDEKLVGQKEAHRAYSEGATIDNPPWIHTDSAG